MSKPKPDKEYSEKVKKVTPNSPIIKDCILAFLVGGAVCTFGELLFKLYSSVPMDEKSAKTLVSISLIVITAILTGIGVYDRIAKHAGAGVAVPISGFANSVCAPAIEYAVEGHVLGTAEKMFTLAGAVIVYGCSLASFYGMIYYFFLGGKI
ncbi:MAG: stage V sporulation protein AC [Clostridia bacterium]|nr:stage V sporulation protein AC [Clostridia bacterium]